MDKLLADMSMGGRSDEDLRRQARGILCGTSAANAATAFGRHGDRDRFQPILGVVSRIRDSCYSSGGLIAKCGTGSM